MTKLSDSQRKILTAASKAPECDVRDHMAHIKSPTVLQNCVDALCDKNYVALTPVKGKASYLITPEGMEAVGAPGSEALQVDVPLAIREEESQAEAHSDDAAHTTEAPEEESDTEGPEDVETAAAESEQGESAAPVAEKKPDAGKVSKKQLMIDMLSREGGVTHKQLMEALEWKTHSVYGSRSSLNKELMEKHGQIIISEKNASGTLVYKIVDKEVKQPISEDA